MCSRHCLRAIDCLGRAVDGRVGVTWPQGGPDELLKMAKVLRAPRRRTHYGGVPVWWRRSLHGGASVCCIFVEGGMAITPERMEGRTEACSGRVISCDFG